ncbi:helix-turn-helix domain-containing protein [Parasedimentitalea psychrophila]|uniref:Helix-turn-helix domain-containing protein n=1 Tax=Parasedimentitalea psychrophila TaxID=2997337 RepID=A0A9Y2L1K3_9RHOB|nr:helix-turn-helix domain-containing protein [Parasedimentitalea psychrophila]WIY27080.1 helix-turn-helix domain-containing protein [Parasedimentitalea psychrophila]
MGEIERSSKLSNTLSCQAAALRPPDRTRSRFALSLIEREEVSAGLVAKRSCRSIARNRKRSPSTISRETGRNVDDRPIARHLQASVLGTAQSGLNPVRSRSTRLCASGYRGSCV